MCMCMWACLYRFAAQDLHCRFSSQVLFVVMSSCPQMTIGKNGKPVFSKTPRRSQGRWYVQFKNGSRQFLEVDTEESAWQQIRKFAYPGMKGPLEHNIAAISWSMTTDFNMLKGLYLTSDDYPMSAALDKASASSGKRRKLK